MSLPAGLAAAVLLAATAAGACEEYYEIDNTEAREYVATLESTEADEFDQILAFDSLICARRVALRDIALRFGRMAASPSVRAQVLQRALFAMNRLTINLVAAEGISKEQAEIIKSTPVYSYKITHRDLARNCLGLYYTHCNDAALQIVGNKVQLYYNDTAAEFVLDPDGRLTGWYLDGGWRRDGIHPIPAEIVLQ